MRPHGTWRPLRWRAVAALLAIVAAAGLLGSLSLHSSCTSPGPPVSSPDPGTPRADWCDAVHGSAPWAVWTFLPVLACGAAYLAGRRREDWCYAFTALTCVVVLVAAFVAGQLPFAQTI